MQHRSDELTAPPRKSGFVFPQCNAHLSWLLTDATCTTWVEINVSSLIEKRRLGSLIQRPIAGFALGPSWRKAAASPSPSSWNQRLSLMPLDVEIPVLRGFLTSCEAVEWKQNIFSSAGETPDFLFISPRNYWHHHEQHLFRWVLQKWLNWELVVS